MTYPPARKSDKWRSERIRDPFEIFALSPFHATRDFTRAVVFFPGECSLGVHQKNYCRELNLLKINYEIKRVSLRYLLHDGNKSRPLFLKSFSRNQVILG